MTAPGNYLRQAKIPVRQTASATGVLQVLLVAPYTSKGGGMGRMMAYLADPAAPDGVRIGAEFIRVESRGGSGAILSIGPCLLAAWQIWRAARRSRATILHANVAERGSIVRKGLLLLLGRACGLPTVLHLHAAELISTYDDMPALFRLSIGIVFRRVDVCIVLGRPWQVWLQHTLHVDPSRIEILPNGVPYPAILPFHPTSQPCLLVFLGNLLPRKGLPDLIAALATDRLRNGAWDLVVAGGGDPAPLNRQIERTGLGARIRFAGWLDRADVTALLARATMLILPSYQEGLPLVLLEAASLGVPVVTTYAGAIPELFTDGETALLVEAGDITALAASIGRLIDDPAERARLGRNARALHARSLSIDSFRRGLWQIYARHCS